MKQLTILIALALIISVTGVYAQPGPCCDRNPGKFSKGQGSFGCDTPGLGMHGNFLMGMDLDKDQLAKLNLLKRGHMEKMIELKGNMEGAHGKIKLLLTDDKFDEKKLNNLVDKMTKMRAETMKEQIKHKRAIRDLLTPDQKTVFDSKVLCQGSPHKMKKGMKGKHRKF